jgi:hypothetical protein
MSLLRESIRKHLILEKRIAQVVTNLKVSFNFEVDRKSHAFDRATRPELAGTEYNQRPIENKEIKEVISMVRGEIAEKIVNREIFNKKPFIVKSIQWELALAINPIHIEGTYWRLEITTVFRESPSNPFRVGEGQLVIWVD